MSQVTVHRWSLDCIDRRNGKNTAKFYKIYVFPGEEVDECPWTELRHWGRLGSEGRFEPIGHSSQEDAIKSATMKAYAERGKGYVPKAEDSFPYDSAKRFTPKFLEQAAAVEQNRIADMGLTKSELDTLCHDAQLLIVQLQDPTQGIDLDAIHSLKLRWNEFVTQYERASASMKMTDLLTAQRMLNDAKVTS